MYFKCLICKFVLSTLYFGQRRTKYRVQNINDIFWIRYSIIFWLHLFAKVYHKRLQSNLWLSCLHSYPASALGIAHPSSTENHVDHQALAFYELRLPANNFSIQLLASSPMQPGLKKKPFCDPSTHHRKTKPSEKI